MPGDVDEQLREGLRTHGYSRVEDGLIWETYMGDDLVVQWPDTGNEGMVSRAAFLYSHVGASEARVPEVVDYGEEHPVYLAVKKVGETQLSALGAGGDRKREAVRSAGEALGQVHSAAGFGYGEIQGEEYTQSGHHTWRAFAEDFVARTAEYTAGGSFGGVMEKTARRFDPERVPETPGSSVPHNDFRSDNVVLDADDRAWVLNLNNAIYGDSRFEYVRSLNVIAGEDEAARVAFRRGYEGATCWS